MHFSVLVFMEEEYNDLEGLMGKYDSNIESEYVETKFITKIEKKDIQAKYDEIVNDVERWRDKIKTWLRFKKMTPIEFFKEYDFYEPDEFGDLGYYANPNSKYDWYEIGGRWKNLLVTKKGMKVSHAPINEIDWNATKDLFKETLIEGYKKHIHHETLEEYLENNYKDFYTFIWNILDCNDWIDLEDKKNPNKIVEEYISNYKDRKDIEVYIVDCHF